MRLLRRLSPAAWAALALLALPRAAWSQDEAAPAEGEAGKEEAPAEGEKKPAEEEAPLINAETGKPDVERLLEYLDDLYRADSSIATMSLTVTKPRRTRTLRMKSWSKGTEKALIVIESPAREKGITTLKVGKNLWNYLPRISRTIRIPPSMMLGSWMGSDFTNDDLVRESSMLDDFDGEVVGRTSGKEGEDPEGWLINLTAKEGVVGLWKRIEYVISLDGKLPLLARHYDRKGRLSRIMEFTDVREFDGRAIPTRMALTPVDKEGHKTEMVYEDITFNVDVPESTFSLSRLERKR